VAAKLVDPDRQLVNLLGDGGFLMCSMELATVVEQGLDGVTLVMNDSAYGMIKQSQRGRGVAEVATDIPPTDYASMAEAYGVRGVRIESPDEVRPALEAVVPKHVVLDVVTDPDADYVSRTIW
jgi:acetolactate synthase-1/2/3 large subunit